MQSKFEPTAMQDAKKLLEEKLEQTQKRIKRVQQEQEELNNKPPKELTKVEKVFQWFSQLF